MQQLADAREAVLESLEFLEGLGHGECPEEDCTCDKVHRIPAERDASQGCWLPSPPPPPEAMRQESMMESCGMLVGKSASRACGTEPRESSCCEGRSTTCAHGWPATVQLRDYTMELPQGKGTVKGIVASSPTSSALLDDRGRVKSTFMDPTGPAHLSWNLLGLCVLLADLSITPFALAWELPFVGVLRQYSIVSLSYWTLDIAITCTTGFYKDGVLITGCRQKARRYAGTFLLDSFVVVCDWVSIAILIEGGVGANMSRAGLRMLRFTKFGRLLRVMLLLRVIRVMAIIESIFERILVEHIRKILAMSSLALVLLWFNHVIACVWFYISNSGVISAEKTWTDMFNGRDDEYFEQYVVAYHWTIAQVTLGSNDVVCGNAVERVFNICCLIAGLVLGSTLISAFSASMVELQMANKDRNHKLRTLRRYLRENDVSHSLSLAVQQQVNERINERRDLIESQVIALQLLSSSLRSEVRYEVARPSLLSHALFTQLSTLDTAWCVDFCEEGIDIATLSAQDELFISGGTAKSAYSLMKGSARYTLEVSLVGGLMPLMPAADLVEQGEWLAEATLWSEWIHVGSALAATGCQVLQVSPIALHRSTVHYPDIHRVAREYGRQFHRRIVSAGSQGADFPTDLYVPSTDWDDMVLSMTSQVQSIISLAAAERLEVGRTTRRTTISRSDNIALREEITAGKSILILNAHGVPERIVSVVVLHISNGDGHVFAQVAKYEHGMATPTCELPGMKRENSELLGDALARLRSTKLSPLDNNLQVMRSECLTTTKRSKQHKVNTKYLRHVFHCSLLDDFEAPTCTAAAPFEAGAFDRMFSKSSCTMGSETTASVRSTGFAELGDLATREVFFFRYGTKGAFYAWLSQHEFDHLSSPAGEHMASSWIRHIGHPPRG